MARPIIQPIPVRRSFEHLGPSSFAADAVTDRGRSGAGRRWALTAILTVTVLAVALGALVLWLDA